MTTYPQKSYPADGATISPTIPAVTGLSMAVKCWESPLQTITLTLTDVHIPLADNAGVVAYGGLKVLDLPEGLLHVFPPILDLAITKSSAGVNADWDGDIGLGTVTASNNATLSSTEQNLVPTTATPQAVAGVTTGDAVGTGSTTLDGTATAPDVFLNVLVDDADHDVTGTACDLIFNGTITLHYLYCGNN